MVKHRLMEVRPDAQTADRPVGVCIDFSQRTHIPSSELAVLLTAVENVKKSGTRIVLTGVHDNVRRVLETTHLDRVFSIQPLGIMLGPDSTGVGPVIPGVG